MQREDHAEQTEDTDEANLSEDELFRLLCTAIAQMQKDRKTPTAGSVKVRMKLLDARFDDRAYKKAKWTGFLSDAERRGLIVLGDNPANRTIKLASGQSAESQYSALDNVMRDSGGDKNWVDFATINNKLLEGGIDIRKEHGVRLKTYMNNAAKLGLVDTKRNGKVWSAKLVKKPR